MIIAKRDDFKKLLEENPGKKFAFFEYTPQVFKIVYMFQKKTMMIFFIPTIGILMSIIVMIYLLFWSL